VSTYSLYLLLIVQVNFNGVFFPCWRYGRPLPFFPCKTRIAFWFPPSIKDPGLPCGRGNIGTLFGDFDRDGPYDFPCFCFAERPHITPFFFQGSYVAFFLSLAPETLVPYCPFSIAARTSNFPFFFLVFCWNSSVRTGSFLLFADNRWGPYLICLLSVSRNSL